MDYSLVRLARRSATVVHHNDRLYIETHDRPALLASPPGQLLVTSDAIKDLVYNRFALLRSKKDYSLVRPAQSAATVVHHTNSL